ncbi:MAG: DUF4372 domain-containing protein [Bacteroidales bacterium]|jgi:hypothetical protein|nr:DUF4372 domain-containing protein [Bacteroidales bacterium]
MNLGRTVFTQLMIFKPEYEFHKGIDHYKGDCRGRKFSCRENFLVMSFAQLTGRESLCDIETRLTAFTSKLYHSGINLPISRSTLADANEKRIWQIYADFAHILIKEAKPLYFNDKEFRLDLDNDINILDKTPVEPVL